jgi:hypothetical protein
MRKEERNKAGTYFVGRTGMVRDSEAMVDSFSPTISIRKRVVGKRTDLI